MTYRIEDFPISLNNAERLAVQTKQGNILGPAALAIVISACLFLDGLIVFFHTKTTPILEIAISVPMPWIIFGGIFGVVFANAYQSPDVSGLDPLDKSTLLLDEIGVHVTIGEHEKNYPWASISSAHIIDAHPKGNSDAHVRAIHIVMMGQFETDKYSNLIDKSFGISVDDLHDLIQQGMVRWGNRVPS